LRSMLTFSRRGFLAGSLATAASPSLAVPRAPAVPSNPLVRQRADAQIFRHEDGLYYMTASVPEYDRLIIRRAASLGALDTAHEAVIWRRPAQGRLGGYIWAPELHRIDGVWHMYFAAGDAGEPFRIRTYALRCSGRDPLTGKWTLLGQLKTPWDSFTLDSTSFVHRGTRYLCWAQRETGIATNSNLYLAPLATPITFARPPVRLSVPTLDWEIQGFKVNEAPAILSRHGRLFLTYSASATDARYCLGMLTADAGADIMSAASWSKSAEPVFVTSEQTHVYGPGHNSFTVDEHGRDMLIYHGRDYRQIEGDPLFDPNRHTRAQRLYYRADGTPDFGIPVGNGPLPDRLSPLDAPNRFLGHRDGRLLVGDLPLPSTQFRQLAGTGRGIMLAPVDAPDRVVSYTPSGEVSLRAAGAGNGTFRPVKGLAHPGDLSFEALGAPGHYLQHRSGSVVIAPIGTAAARRSATFSLT
jgi:GH43 family beta-xylosidase